MSPFILASRVIRPHQVNANWNGEWNPKRHKDDEQTNWSCHMRIVKDHDRK